jgi:chromodomain-containing protein
VESILDARVRKNRNPEKKEYLEWKRYPLQEATWESTTNMASAEVATLEFETRFPCTRMKKGVHVDGFFSNYSC